MGIDSLKQGSPRSPGKMESLLKSWAFESFLKRFYNQPLYKDQTIGDVLDQWPETVAQSIQIHDPEFAQQRTPVQRQNYLKQLILDETEKGFQLLNQLQLQIAAYILNQALPSHIQLCPITQNLAENQHDFNWDFFVESSSHRQYYFWQFFPDQWQARESLFEIEQKWDSSAAQATTIDEKKKNSSTAMELITNRDIASLLKGWQLDQGHKVNVSALPISWEETTALFKDAAQNKWSSLVLGRFAEIFEVSAEQAETIGLPFFLWKQAKDWPVEAPEALHSSSREQRAGSANKAIQATQWFNRLATILTSPVGGVLVVGFGWYAQNVLGRIWQRHHLVDKLAQDNDSLRLQMSRLRAFQ